MGFYSIGYKIQRNNSYLNTIELHIKTKCPNIIFIVIKID